MGLHILQPQQNWGEAFAQGLSQGVLGQQQRQQGLSDKMMMDKQDLSNQMALQQMKGEQSLQEKLLASKENLKKIKGIKRSLKALDMPEEWAEFEPAVQKTLIQDSLFSKFLQEGEEPLEVGGEEVSVTRGPRGEETITKETEEEEREPVKKSKYSPKQLEKMLTNPRTAQLAKSIIDREEKATDRDIKREERSEDKAFKRNEKYLEKIDNQAIDQPKKDLALNQMRIALDSGNFSNWKNAIGDFYGIPFLKNDEANTVSSAIKEHVMSDLSSLTGRPNQFIEKQMTLALINPQYSKKANEAILYGLEGLNKLKKRETEITNEMEDKLVSQGKEVPRNFQRQVNQKLKKEVDAFDKEYQQKVSKMLKGLPQEEPDDWDKIGMIENGKRWVETANGEIALIPVENYQIALEAKRIKR